MTDAGCRGFDVMDSAADNDTVRASIRIDRAMRRFSRPIVHASIRVLLASCIVVLPASATAETAGRCVAVRVPTDSQDVTCPLDPSTIGRPLRFVAEFAGSHDDTRLTLAATLGGEPLTCAEGSRTTLFAEDGVVQLDCRFRVAKPVSDGAALPPLKVTLTVHHAQYVSASLEAE